MDSSVAQHEKKRSSGASAPLDPKNLAGQDLSGRDLSGADLVRADLSGANLLKADLSAAKLSHANLEGAELTAAKLCDAVLEDANVRGAGLGHADLRGAHLFGANLEGATLSKANLSGADLRCANLQGARIREAQLKNTDLTNADLRHADMSLSDVAGACLDNADLRQARLRATRGFRSAQWFGADIRDINFCGAYQLRRFVIDQNYIREFRESSRWTGLVYYVWWLTSDCGRSLLRWCACIALMVLMYAWLFSLVAVDFGPHEPGRLAAVYYSVVTLTTLGYGEILPASAAGQVVVIAEVITGYVMLGGLLSIFANKLARRGE